MRIDLQGTIWIFMHAILTGLMKWLWLPGAFQSGYLECSTLHELPEIKAFICTSRQKMWVSKDCRTELQKPNWTIRFFKCLSRWLSCCSFTWSCNTHFRWWHFCLFMKIHKKSLNSKELGSVLSGFSVLRKIFEVWYLSYTWC